MSKNQNQKEMDISFKGDIEDRADYLQEILIQEMSKFKDDPFAGMQERRVSHKLPSEMERIACEEALEDAQIAKKDIDMLMVNSLPPDKYNPPNAFKVHRDLGLTSARCMEIGTVCYSYLSMLDIAHQYIRNGAAKNVLIAASNDYSSIMDYSTSVSVAAGDGAVASVIGPCPSDKGLQISHHGVESEFYSGMIMTRRAPLRPVTPEYEFADVQSKEKVYFTIDDQLIAKKLVSRLPLWAEDVRDDFFNQGKYSQDDIDLFIPNAAMAFYTPIVSRVLGISAEKASDNISKFSNVGAVTSGLNLYTAYKEGRVQNGNNVMFFGHGGGASFGSAIYKWSQPHKSEKV